MRIYSIIDKKIKNKDIVLNALEQLKKQYEGVLDVIWQTEEQDLSNLEWWEYSAPSGSFGLSLNWLKQDTKRISDLIHGLADNILYFIDESNWKEPNNAWGWSEGAFFNNFQVELIRVNDSPQIVEWIVKMETAHTLDNFTYKEIGIDLNKFFNVDSFDQRIVHGNIPPPYPEWVFDYRSYIVKMKDILQRTFRNRLIVNKITLLQLLVQLYRRLILKLNGASAMEPLLASDFKLSKLKGKE